MASKPTQRRVPTNATRSHPDRAEETQLTRDRLTTAQAIVKWLANQYIEIDGKEVRVFGGVHAIFGHGNVTSLGQALEEARDGLPTWRGQNEQGMALAGVAYSKAHLRRRIAIAATSVGPGTSNLMTAAAVAHVNRLPLLMLCGDYFAHRIADPVLQQLETFQDPTASICDSFKPVTRYWDRIMRPEQILRSLPQALAVMLDPADCGPAFLALPQDVQAEAFDYPPEFFARQVHYVRRHAPDVRDVNRAAALVKESKRPMILAGGGVRYSGANDALADFSLRRGIPVAETPVGKSTLLGSHPCNLGTLGTIGSNAANLVAADADLVIAIGTRLQDFTTGSWTVFADPSVKFILMNTSRWDSHKRAGCAVIGDAAASLSSLDSLLGEYIAPADWLALAREHRDEWDRQLAAWPSRSDLHPPAYAQVVMAINELLTPDDYVVCAAGGIIGEMTMCWNAVGVNTFDAEWGMSTMGYEVSGSWGARIARDHGEVVAFMGDGSYMMMNSDVFSVALYGQKVIYVLCDNGGFAVINRLQVGKGGVEFGNLYSTVPNATKARVDFCQHMSAMGVTAERVDDLSEVPAAFERARASSSSYAIVVSVQAYEWLESNAWWEVGVPEVSKRDAIAQARRESDLGKAKQRLI